jgi:ribosomal protein L35AE/L33A
MQEMVGDAVAGLLRRRGRDGLHVALRELRDPAAPAADDGVAVRRGGGHERLAAIRPVHAAQRSDVAEDVEGAVHRGEPQLGAALAGRVVHLHGADTRGCLSHRFEHGAPLPCEPQAALRQLPCDPVRVQRHPTHPSLLMKVKTGFSKRC